MNKEQEKLDNWFQEKDWPYWQPLEIVARLAEEVGEFSRLVNHLYGPKQKKDNEDKQELREEVGDILFTLACFCNAHDIDLDEALEASLDKVMDRDSDRFD